MQYFLILPRPTDNLSAKQKPSSSAFPRDRIDEIIVQICHIFETPILSQHGLTKVNYQCNSSIGDQRISLQHWHLFQERFLSAWPDFCSQQVGQFWDDITPIFHAYNFGANWPIVPTGNRMDDIDAMASMFDEFCDVSTASSATLAIATEVHLHGHSLLIRTNYLSKSFTAAKVKDFTIYPIVKRMSFDGLPDGTSCRYSPISLC
jgi:hypothetical protein